MCFKFKHVVLTDETSQISRLVKVVIPPKGHGTCCPVKLIDFLLTCAEQSKGMLQIQDVGLCRVLPEWRDVLNACKLEQIIWPTHFHAYAKARRLAAAEGLTCNDGAGDGAIDVEISARNR